MFAAVAKITVQMCETSAYRPRAARMLLRACLLCSSVLPLAQKFVYDLGRYFRIKSTTT